MYLILLLVIAAPILAHSVISTPINPMTKTLYDFIQNLPPNSLVVESFDYATSVVPELHPQAIVVTQQLFLRPLKVLFVALDPNGPPMAQAVLDTINKNNKTYGVDYATLGLIPNSASEIGMVSNITQFLPLDTHSNPTASLPIMKEFPAGKMASLLISYDDDSTALFSYLQYWQGRAGVPVAVGSTALLAPGYLPFYNSKQLVGVLISAPAAAEYELLLNSPPPEGYGCCLGISGATSALVSQSTAHLLIIGMVVVGNVAYFAGRRRRPEKEK